jgi:hypothetical protein
MSGVLNDCDTLLLGAAVRIVNPKNASIILTTDAPAFHVNSAGVADIDTITVTATLYNLDGPLTFSAQGATLTNVTDRAATVTYANMAGATAIITASMVSGGVTFSQSCIIATTQDGTSGGSAKVLTLSPTEQVFKITKAGVNSPESITLTASGQNLVGTPSFTIPVGTATLTAGANASQKVLTFANMTTDSVTVQVALDGLTDRVTIIKVREGIDGVDGITALLTNESVTLPAGSNGVVSSYSGAVCTMKVYKGTADDTANWAFASAPASSADSLEYSRTGETVTVTGMAAGVDSAYVDITASRTGYPSITKRFSVSKSKAGESIAGARGAGMYFTPGSAWSDGAADAVTPGGNVVGDVVTISDGSTYSMTKKWDGSAWVVMGAVFDGSLFVTGSIHGAALMAGTVDIRAPDGTVILYANASLAQQTSSTPNLVPHLYGWPAANRSAGAALAFNPADVHTLNGEFLLLLPGSGYVGATSAKIGILPNATYTVSFDAFCDSGVQNLWVDLYGPNVDTFGIAAAITTTQNHFYFTESITHADAPLAGLRFFKETPGASRVLISNVKVRYGSKDDAWSDDITTPQNSASMVMPNSITNVQFGGDLWGSAWNGIVGPGGAGWMLHRNGSIYLNDARLRGSVMGGDYTGYTWVEGDRGPNDRKRGYYLGAEGLLLGNPSRGGYFQVTDSGDIYAQNFSIAGGVPTFTNPKIVSNMSAVISDTQLLNQPNSVYVFFDKGVSVSGGTGPFTYRYTLSIEEYDLAIIGDPTLAVVRLRARGNNSTPSGYLMVEVTDSYGAKAYARCRIQVQYENGALN